MSASIRASGIDPESIDARVDLLADAELLVRKRPPGFVEVPHGHREHVIMCTLGRPIAGQSVHSRLVSNDQAREWRNCPAGHVTFLPADYGFAWEWSYASESVHIAIPPDRLADLTVGTRDSANPVHPQELRPVFREFDETIANLLYCLRDEVGKDALGADLLTSSLLTALAVQIVRLAGGRSPARSMPPSSGLSNAQRRRAVDLLKERMRDKFPLRELAAEFDLSPYHFSRLFKMATGMPPHQFQLQLRVKCAREALLAQPARTIADIACDLGFADESHFRRHFKRIVGVTPSAYRRQQ